MLLDLKSRKVVGEPLFTVPEEHGVDKMRFNDGKAAPGGALIIGRPCHWADQLPPEIGSRPTALSASLSYGSKSFPLSSQA